MTRLERISPSRRVRPASCGRLRHQPGEFLPRHLHEVGFATVVLRGCYVEAGDTGRHRAHPGDVLLHRSFEFHLDRFDHGGAEVLVVPIAFEGFTHDIGEITDPDAIVRLVESTPEHTEAVLLSQLRPKMVDALEWPDLLARNLREDPSLCLGHWASKHGLAAGSVSRGFAQIYGVSPATFRLQQRTHRAIRSILAGRMALTAIAQDCGFADHAHMARSVQRVAGISASKLRAHRALPVGNPAAL